MKIERIVVGIDFSSYSEIARQRAVELAAVFRAKVILVHALESSDYRGQESWLLRNPTFNQAEEKSRELAREQMMRLARESSSDREAAFEVSDLGPDKALFDAVRRHDADLVAVGTHGRTGFERLTLARITERVVRNSPCSVLVARAARAGTSGLRRILVPTDFSESADDALSLACSLVADDGQIDVLHCWLVHFFPTGYHGLYEEAISLEPEMADSIRKQGAKLIQRFRAPHINLEFMERFSSPGSGIHEQLEARPYDLVVMGSHSRHGVKRLLLGSTAEAMVRHANCSVLVVRRPAVNISR